MRTASMGVEKDIEIVTAQETALRLPYFGSDQAWAVGSAMRAEAMRRGATMSFDIQVASRTLFCCSMQDAEPSQADWIRRKRNTVMRFGRSSYLLGLKLELEGKTMEARHNLPIADYAMHGGGFPIYLAGTGLVGTVIASGLPQRDDHVLVVGALAAVFGIEVPRLE